jgi:hypothetical protein
MLVAKCAMAENDEARLRRCFDVAKGGLELSPRGW